MTHQQSDIRSQLNQAMADTNHQKLSSIFKTIVLCGRQNIALRGHRDNATDIEKDPLDTENRGNFWALLNFRGDIVLGEHLTGASRNSTYTSPIIQNQVIGVLAGQQSSERFIKRSGSVS